MIPLFKTHASIGRSLLSAKKAFELADSVGLDKAVFVEDSFYSFREINELAAKFKIQLVFGIRLSVAQTLQDVPTKLVFFAKNNAGILSCKKLYTAANCSDEQFLDLSSVSADELKHVRIAVPFYDSFIMRNIFNFGMSFLDLRDKDHFFFKEDNHHPFDFQISEALEAFGAKPVVEAKSIFYEKREDVDAFLFYKATCNRSQGKNPSFDRPYVEDFCSCEFSWESYLDHHVTK